MNTSALKSFAPAVRRQLMEAVGRKLDIVLSAQTPDYLTTYAPQVAALRKLAQADRAGLVESVAYTWFNRLAALRYLDTRGWHPFRARVLTAASGEETQPELLKLMRTGGLPEELARYTDTARLNDLLDGRIPSSNPQGEVYRHLVLAACRFYHGLLPDLFERLDDATELLLPDDLITEHSVVQGFRTQIRDQDCEQVELLGWLYQFYISEKKDAVMARKSAVPTEDIPAVTQLFTPHWIVRYLVENSLGRLWLLNRPSSRLREQMPYYIQGEGETDFLRITRPEEIRMIDPAVGSGHMLTYAFDLLHAIYEEEGYAPSAIPGLILKHNLYGVDIDPRAAQLASLALVLKAREKARRFFQPDQLTQPHVIALQDMHFEEWELREYVRALDLGELFNQPVFELLGQFRYATTLGSLIQPVLHGREILKLKEQIEEKDLGGELFLSETHQKVLRVLEQAEYLAQPYHVAIANPPYMGNRSMCGPLKQMAAEHFPDSKLDLFAMFIERCLSLCGSHGSVAMITMHSWMFLSRYEQLRAKIVGQHRISSLAHLGTRAFDTIGGEVVSTAAFVLNKNGESSIPGTFFRLTSGRTEAEKNDQLLSSLHSPSRAFIASGTEFSRIDGAPIAYWLSDRYRECFVAFQPLKKVFSPAVGINTGDNDRFLRRWYEVPVASQYRAAASIEDAKSRPEKWFPYNKGGTLRKWYGNQEFVVNWENDGAALKEYARERNAGRHWSRYIQNLNQMFRECVTWADITTSAFAARYSPPGFLFDVKGSSGTVTDGGDLHVILALLCGTLMQQFMKALNPTSTFQVGDLSRIPYPNLTGECANAVRSNSFAAIGISKRDWDNFETSWAFDDLPLLRAGVKNATLGASWALWKEDCDTAIKRMQELEVENNRLLIEAYSLQGELSSAVPEEEITLSRADARRDIAAFLSYAIGCMMGRYSLDIPGLVLGDARDTLEHYLAKVGKPLEQLTFVPDQDGIIPVLEGDWFEDDIVARTRDFLRATFGEATLRENIRFIEESLGKDLRKYFLNDFYKDHLQTYKKRPIYWMVQSPKKGFSVLIYLHRYTRDTMNLVLNRYLREYEAKLRSRIEHLTLVQANDATIPRDKTAARKEADRLTKILHECEEWERQTLLPLAQQRLALDLDDGVKVNYLKLGEALAPIPGLAAKDAE